MIFIKCGHYPVADPGGMNCFMICSGAVLLPYFLLVSHQRLHHFSGGRERNLRRGSWGLSQIDSGPEGGCAEGDVWPTKSGSGGDYLAEPRRELLQE